MTTLKKPAMRVQTLLKLSVVAALITILMKSAAWWFTDSVGLLSDALESFVNLASALFAILMVTIAARPADEDHPSGHSKAEYFSSGFEGLLIMGAALGIVWAAVDRFMHSHSLQALGWGIGLSVVSSGINGALAWRMLKASREHRSIVLEADARHLITDVWTSAGVVVGLILVHLTGWLWIDPLLAIGVAINILREGLHLAWRSVEGLMDSAVEPEVRTKIDGTLAQFAKKSVRFDHVVTRRAGQRRFVDMHMHTPDHWTLGHAAELRNRVEEALMQAVPGLRASIQLLPMHLEAHCHTAPDDLPA
jgi:cation diffusion facilitator family transporter